VETDTTQVEQGMRICVYPDPVLRNQAEALHDIDQTVLDLAERMTETMYKAPGIGLAANQVGQLKRVIVFDLKPGEEGKCPCMLINPEIVAEEGKITHEEACLSVVDYSAEVSRSARALVRGLDKDGNPLEIEADGLLAICLQHEIDHLNGVLFIDHISSLKRALYKKKLKKMKI
jgi:peptide deformylase